MIGDHLQVTIARAADYARTAGHEYVTLEHLLLALTHDPEGREALLAVGADVERLRDELEMQLDGLEVVEDAEPDFTLGVHRVVQGAVLQLHASGKGARTPTGRACWWNCWRRPTPGPRRAGSPGRDPAGRAGVRLPRHGEGGGPQPRAPCGGRGGRCAGSRG